MLKCFHASYLVILRRGSVFNRAKKDMEVKRLKLTEQELARRIVNAKTKVTITTERNWYIEGIFSPSFAYIPVGAECFEAVDTEKLRKILENEGLYMSAWKGESKYFIVDTKEYPKGYLPMM